MKKYFILIFLGWVTLTSYGVQANTKTCSIYDAIYKPHPSYKSPNNIPHKKADNIAFVMEVKRPKEGEKGGAFRSIFFHITALDKTTGKKVSTMRLADTCSNGVVRCSLNTHAGQFKLNALMEDLKSGFSFEPIALKKDFSPTRYNSKEAPYTFIFPNTASQFYYERNNVNLENDMNEFVRFYTDEKIFPDFGGYDIWIMNSCHP
ncbi:MAG: hypothetical protein JKY51_09390 [Opitutaceae bacterium]|nr:hypothetical protein [Opitutaceae bacterium]